MATPPPVAVSITCTPNKNDKQKSKTVGAYRIRPHVGGNAMFAANKPTSF